MRLQPGHDLYCSIQRCSGSSLTSPCLEAAKVVVAKIVNAVVNAVVTAAAIKTKIDRFLAIVFMLTPEQK